MRYIILYVILGVFLFFWGGCSTTKNLPEGEVLYTGIKSIEVVNMDSTTAGENARSEVEAAFAYPPNNALLGSSSIKLPLPFGLWAYNALVNKKGKVGKWLFKKLAAKPVFISTVNPDVRVRVADNLLREHGYFSGFSEYELVPNKKNPRKAALRYKITMNHPYTFDSIAYINLHRRTDSIVKANLGESYLKKNDNFNAGNLDSERSRISLLLRDNGYYYYRPDFITYQADTFLTPGKVNLRVTPKAGLPNIALRPWKIGNVHVWLNGYDNEEPTDSVTYIDMVMHYQGKLRARPSALYKRLFLRSGDLYSQSKQEQTQTAFSRLGIFRYAEMQYVPRDTTQRIGTLDLNIRTVYDLPLDGELEFNVTSKSNDQIGPGAIFSMTKRNLFGGGETFTTQVKGSYEWQTGNRVGSSNSAINSYELGVSATITFPEMLVPGIYKFKDNYPASTSFKLYADLLNRARFFKILSFGGESAYDFQPTPTSRHSVTLFNLSFNKLQHTTYEFDSITTANPALYISLKDQFIPMMGYTYTYDNSSITAKRNHLWWQTSISQAGNLLSCFYAIAGNKFSTPNKKLLGNPFAQFVKLTSEIRYNYQIGRKQNLVGRLMAGVIYSYGNAEGHISPYSEQFYIGGANSIRAFTIRSIGPGRFSPDPNNEYAYIDQVGDVKFEANLEYRFPILGDLNGAMFLDAGNIWLLHEDPQRPGGVLRLGHFLKDLALGTGVGLRYDLSFIVVRLDCGIALHVPYETGKKGYYNIPRFKDGLGFHLAIGYPF